MVEAGLINKWMDEESGNQVGDHCWKPPSYDKSQGILPLSFQDFLGCFAVYLGGESNSL